MSLNYVNLVLDYYDGQGNPVTTGTVTLSPNATVLDAADHIVVTQKPVVVNLFGNPAPVVQLAATDNDGLNPPGWGWLVQPQFPGAPPGDTYELLFDSGSTQYMSGLTAATEGPEITTYATAAALAAETSRAEAAEAAITAAAADALAPTGVKTSNYTAAAGDMVRCDTTSVSFTVTLPTGPADGTVIGAKLIASASPVNAVTIACGGSDVFNKTGGSATLTLSLLNQGAVFQYIASGAIWLVTADDLPLGQLDARYPAATSTDAYSRTEVMATPPGAGLRDFISARDAPFGAKFDGSTDDSTALNAAQQPSSTLHLPDGTAVVGTAITWNQSKVTIRGEGMYSTTVKSTGGLLGILKQVPTGTGFVSEVEISDLTLDCSGSSGSSYGIQANGSAITRLTVRRVRFVNCPVSMITGGYAANYVIEDCVGDGAGNGSTGGTFVNMSSLPMESLIVRRNKIRFANQGIVVGSSGFHSAYVEISDNDIDLGWWLIKSAFTGSGGTVTYTAGGLADTAASFSGITTNTTVRVMPVRQTGTLTSGSSGTFITDSAATFTTNAVKRGEIVRCGTAFAVVSKVVAQTKLHVEEWLDQATYQPVVPPSLGSSYTVYGVILGNITASTSTTLTVSHGAGHGGSAWYDLTGTELTPASGTLYEVLVPHPSYPVYCDTVTEKLQITGNRIRRGWSDGIECFGSRAIITGNIVEDGQDEGIVFQGTASGLISGNLCKHNGTSGIDIISSSTDIEVGPNLLQDNTWGAPVSSALGQMVISSSTALTVTGGKAYSAGEASPQYGLVLNGTPSGVKVLGFSGISSGTADVYVASTATAGAVQLLDVTGVIAYQGTTNGQLTRVSGTGAPSLIASPGSTFMRTDGAAGTTLYVKETGNGSSGWTPFTGSGTTAIGGQAAYAKATSSVVATITASGTWTAPASPLTITLPNDGNTYRIDLTAQDVLTNGNSNTQVGIGTSAAAGSILANTLVNQSSTSAAGVNVVAQKVTGSGQTVGVYMLSTLSSATVTLAAGGSTSALVELAAYRVA